MDTFTCGNCQQQFTDIELFMAHKKAISEGSTCIAANESFTTSTVVTIEQSTNGNIALQEDSVTATSQTIETVATQPMETVPAQQMQAVATQPMETIASQPMETIAPQPLENVAPQPMETVAPQPMETVAAQPMETVAAQPMETVAAQPMETVAAQPMETVAAQPMETVEVASQQQSTDPIIFVCRHCNQFSAQKEPLVEHVRASHGITEDYDSSITTLQALPGTAPPVVPKIPLPNVQKITTAPVGRRRGRPRKVPKTEEQLKEEERKKQEEEEKKAAMKRLEETMTDSTDGFECSDCKRKFSKVRQLKHHRCVPDYFDDEPVTKRSRGRPSIARSENRDGDNNGTMQSTNDGQANDETSQPSLMVFDGKNEANVKISQDEDGEDTAKSGKAKRDKRSRMSYLEKYVVGEITEHCIQQTINQGNAVPHRSNTNNPVLRVFTCPHCNKLFKYRHALAVHILIHKDIKPFKCDLCSYASNSSGNLNVHMRKHTGEKFKCDKCDFTCINKGHLKVHKAKHGSVRYECELCGKKVHHPTELLKHIKYKHDIDKDPHAKEFFERKKMESRSGRRALLYQCNICERKFKTKRDHDIHMYLHTNEKPFKCDLCDYATARKPYIRAHVRKHKIIYKCCYCDDKHLSSVKLSTHLQQTHSEEADFALNQALNASINTSYYLSETDSKNPDAEDTASLDFLHQETVNTTTTTTTTTTQDDGEDPVTKDSEAEVETSPKEEKTVANPIKPTNAEPVAVINGLNYEHMSITLLDKLKEIFGHFECEDCGKLFVAKVEYEKHVVIHTADKSHKCQQCEYATHHADGLRRHMESVHSGIKYKCAECGLETASKYYLKIHMKKHLGGKQYQCTLCAFNTTDETEIKTHIGDLHPEITPAELEMVMGRRARIKSKLGKRPYKCPYCGKLFHRGSSDLKRHIWAHKGINPFRCHICGHGTRSNSNLKAHMLKHSDAKNHLCDECGKSFKTKNSLQVHQLGHKNEKKFECPYCEYTALQPAHLKRHMETHGGLKPYKCGLCVNYTCNNKGTLRSHYSKKHPGEPFKEDQIIADINKETSNIVSFPCQQCDYIFSNKWDLRAHLKKKHKIDTDTGIGGSSEQQQTIAVPVDILTAAEAAAAASNAGQAEVVTVSQTSLQDVDQNLQYTDTSQIQLQQSTDRNAVNILQQIMGMQDLATVATAVASQDGTVTSDAVTYATTSDTQPTLVTTSEGQTYVAVTPDSHGLVAVAPNSVVIRQTPDAVSEQVVGETTAEDNKNYHVVLLTQSQDN
ncbi:zinc finger protein ZFAT-like [Glandiceps talaboti]